jgi:hypothetical protein
MISNQRIDLNVNNYSKSQSILIFDLIFSRILSKNTL